MYRKNKGKADLSIQGISKVTLSELRAYSFSLPNPEETHTFGKHVFSLYRAKDMFNSSWNNALLQRIVTEARKTYREMYGEIELLDKYDKKSSIYLVRIKYPLYLKKDRQIDVEEWFSLRFVPASHAPVSNEDLNFYIYDSGFKKMPLWEFVIKYFRLKGDHEYKKILSTFVAQSRFCAIRPYAAIDKEQVLLDNYLKRRKNPLKNAFAGIGYALINKQFMHDSKEGKFPIKYITAQMNQSLIDNILNYPPYSIRTTISLPFVSFKDALNLPINEKIYLNRNKAEIPVFLYPGYFLERKALSETLRACVKAGLLSERTLKEFLYDVVTTKDFFADPRLIYFRNMGKLLSMKGFNGHDMISGESLRELINKKVPDGPTLFLMEISDWQKGVNKYINFVKNDIKKKLYSLSL